MKSIFVSRRVEVSIKELRKTGKTGINLADKAEKVIDILASGAAQNSSAIIGTTTKYGEKRIQKCQKYDLGCGYRLVTVHQGETLYIPFWEPMITASGGWLIITSTILPRDQG
jgi:hypothetical protein